MKNLINYYYNLYFEDIRLNGNNYYFTSNNGNYYLLYQCNDEYEKIKEIYNTYIEISKYGIYSHQIILNKDQNIMTRYNDKNYMLLKLVSNLPNIEVGINEITYFGNKTNIFKGIINWKKLWMNKVDYFEYQISQVGKRYPLIRESFSYYIGIVENGISLLNEKKEVTFSVSHRRISKNQNIQEFYNPINYIIDTRVRDSAEYFKSIISIDTDIFPDIKKYLMEANLTENEIYYFFVRMFYPTFYFDCYEQIMSGQCEEIKIKEAIKIAPIYEKLLKDLYQFLKYYIKIPEIEWLNNFIW